jgi:asparagine synthetase B (glutamine-hydrolysing)
MCGVCGIAPLREPFLFEAEARVRSMMEALHHRGPDEGAGQPSLPTRLRTFM